MPPDVLASGIDWAVSQRASVITRRGSVLSDSTALRQAVRRALSSDAVVIAASGQARPDDPPGLRPFPASYDEVLSVGAIGPDGGYSR